MKMAVRRLADILGAYARRQGWWPLDFRLYYRANERWGKISFVFVSDGFEAREETESYRSIVEYVRMRTIDDPDLISALGLVSQTFKQMNEGGIYAIDSSYSHVRPRDLVKRALHEIGELCVKYAKERGWADSDYYLFYRVDPATPDRVAIQFVAPDVSSSGGGLSFDDYVRSRLFDEPDLRSTFDLETTAPAESDEDKIEMMKNLGYREFFTISRSLIP